MIVVQYVCVWAMGVGMVGLLLYLMMRTVTCQKGCACGSHGITEIGAESYLDAVAQFKNAPTICIRAMHAEADKEQPPIVLTSGVSGDPGIYQEVYVKATKVDGTVVDILVGINAKGEIRILVTPSFTDEPIVAIYPERVVRAVEDLRC